MSPGPESTPIVAFDEALHGRFVFSSWCAGSSEPRHVLAELIDRGARLVVFTGRADPDLLIGWACALPVPHQQVGVWAYTRNAEGGLARNRGVMKALLAELGVDVTKPMVALFRSPACDGLIRRGWPITYPESSYGNEDREIA